MSKKNTARLSATLAMNALVEVMGEKYAIDEYNHRSKSRARNGSTKTKPGGAFGGKKRAGIKLVRLMMRKGGIK